MKPVLSKLLVAVLLLAAAGNASAGESLRARLLPDITLLLGAENFRWQEMDGNGNRLLTEQGPRYLAGAAVGNVVSRATGVLYEARIQGFTGDVDYDGQDSNGIFTSSDTNYRGWQAEIMGGYRISSPRSALSMDLHAVAGVEDWRRDIDGSINARGNPVGGFVEEYTAYYGRVGAGLLWPHRVATSYLQVGGRRPFRVEEDVDAFNITLAPKEQWSAYAAYELRFPAGRGTALMRLRYDSYRFNRSNSKNIGGSTVWQPESDMDIWGLSLGYVF